MTKAKLITDIDFTGDGEIIIPAGTEGEIFDSDNDEFDYEFVFDTSKYPVFVYDYEVENDV